MLPYNYKPDDFRPAYPYYSKRIYFWPYNLKTNNSNVWSYYWKNQHLPRDEPAPPTCVERFSSMTSLHGFKYVGESDRSMPEKLFWAIVLITVFLLCGYQTWTLILYWSQGRIVMTPENANLNVWDIPFPAITICTDNQLNKTQMKLAEDDLQWDDYKDLKDYADMLCSTNVEGKYASNVISEVALKYALNKLTISCNETIVSVTWVRDRIRPPCFYFQPVLLSTGVCYSLNMVHHNHLFAAEYARLMKKFIPLQFFYESGKDENAWTPDTDYRNSSPIIPPWRVSGDGIFNSVKITLNLHSDNFNHYCPTAGRGLTVIIHNPVDHPIRLSTIYIRPDTLNVILLSADATLTSDPMRSWSPSQRGCYYQHERYLRYFKIYTQNNCEMECRVNKTIEQCGCAAYYHPRSEQTLVCGKESEQCVIEAGSTKFSVFGNRSAAEESDFLNNCNCLPSCTEYSYDIDVTEMNRNWTDFPLNSDMHKSSRNIAVLHIYFKKKHVDYWLRSPMIRFNELIGNIGGVMSLFIGCSIISVFEVIYFFTLRTWLHSRLHNANTNIIRKDNSIKALSLHNNKVLPVVYLH